VESTIEQELCQSIEALEHTLGKMRFVSKVVQLGDIETLAPDELLGEILCDIYSAAARLRSVRAALLAAAPPYADGDDGTLPWQE